MKFRYYVYIIKNDSSGEFYTGYTEDINRRIKEHNLNRSGYTRGKGPWGLVWYGVFDRKSKAIEFEKYLKHGPGYAFARKRFI